MYTVGIQMDLSGLDFRVAEGYRTSHPCHSNFKEKNNNKQMVFNVDPCMILTRSVVTIPTFLAPILVIFHRS